MVGNLAIADERAVDRDAVHYRTRAFGPDARAYAPLVVNISPHGLMARLECQFDEGTRLRFQLPVVGVTLCQVRWSLGGRVGCRFDCAIDRASYYELLAALLRAA